MERLVVLKMAGIDGDVTQRGGKYAVVVDASDADAAFAQLELYEDENRGRAPECSAPETVSSGWAGVIVYTLILLVVYWFQHYPIDGRDWAAAGSADAGLIRQGAWWRTITALCLHGDVLHLAGNLGFGGVFGLLAGQRFGSGVAWCGILLAGALGNAMNAFVQPTTHVSLGASTAVFAALGILAAHTWKGRSGQKDGGVRRWAPVVSGLLLLSFLGMGGERTDVVAHVTGFVSGALLGVLFASFGKEWLLNARFQFALGAGAVAVIAVAWLFALTGHDHWY
jgi:membrane associated rhomboid family serine protease